MDEIVQDTPASQQERGLKRKINAEISSLQNSKGEKGWCLYEVWILFSEVKNRAASPLLNAC